MPSTPRDIPFIIEQISTCVRLANQCADDAIIDHLLELARSFAQRAIELGADPSLIPDIPSLADVY